MDRGLELAGMVYNKSNIEAPLKYTVARGAVCLVEDITERLFVLRKTQTERFFVLRKGATGGKDRMVDCYPHHQSL